MPHRPLTEPWWTPWPGTGPGRDLLGDIEGLTLLELGCGTGDNAAAFAHDGATVTGIDASPAKIDLAGRQPQVGRWLRFEQADAATYLATLTEPVDVVCSIFGALSFHPTGPLLDQIATGLRRGGRLAIAARTPTDRAPAEQARAPWMTHAHGPGDWQHLLERRGLRTTRADVLDHPTDADAPGCVILVAARSPHRY